MERENNKKQEAKSPSKKSDEKIDYIGAHIEPPKPSFMISPKYPYYVPPQIPYYLPPPNANIELPISPLFLKKLSSGQASNNSNKQKPKRNKKKNKNK